MSESKPVGRPTLYKPEYCDELIEYFSADPYEEREREIATKSGDVVTIREDVANDFPTLAGFAIKLGVHTDTLLEWSKVHPEFSVSYKRAKDFQNRFLTVNGLKGLVNSPFGIFTAKNVLGWRDKQPDEIDTVVNNNNTVNTRVEQLTDEQLDARIKELAEKAK